MLNLSTITNESQMFLTLNLSPKTTEKKKLTGQKYLLNGAETP